MPRFFAAVNKYINSHIFLVCFDSSAVELLSSISEVLGSNPPSYRFIFSLKTKVFISDCVSRAGTRLCAFCFVLLPERSAHRLCEDCALCTDNSGNKHLP